MIDTAQRDAMIELASTAGLIRTEREQVEIEHDVDSPLLRDFLKSRELRRELPGDE